MENSLILEFGLLVVYLQVEGACKEDGRGPSIWDSFSRTEGILFFFNNFIRNSPIISFGLTGLTFSSACFESYLCILLLCQARSLTTAMLMLQWINIIDTRSVTLALAVSDHVPFCFFVIAWPCNDYIVSSTFLSLGCDFIIRWMRYTLQCCMAQS